MCFTLRLFGGAALAAACGVVARLSAILDQASAVPDQYPDTPQGGEGGAADAQLDFGFFDHGGGFRRLSLGVSGI